jgi:acyl dehydratase
MKFEEICADQVLEFGDHTVTESEIRQFAEQYDPQPFHIDKELAARSRWGGLISSGFQTCSLAMRMVVDNVLNGSESIGSPGLEYLKWPNPVRVGDQLRMRIHVHETRVSSSGQYGIVNWQWLMLNQLDLPVLDLVAISLFAISGEHSESPSTTRTAGPA